VADRLSAAERSAHMRRIRKRDTSPELVVRRISHSLGYRFRLHRRDLPGTPDLVFPRLRRAILVHGCFWHQHELCRLARQPKSRLDYWLPKLARNVARDALTRQQLERAGWETLIVWECETFDPIRLRENLKRFLSQARAFNSAAR
jgi:DNA mismatch endonuclease (patch repair protein)